MGDIEAEDGHWRNEFEQFAFHVKYTGCKFTANCVGVDTFDIRCECGSEFRGNNGKALSASGLR